MRAAGEVPSTIAPKPFLLVLSFLSTALIVFGTAHNGGRGRCVKPSGLETQERAPGQFAKRFPDRRSAQTIRLDEFILPYSLSRFKGQGAAAPPCQHRGKDAGAAAENFMLQMQGDLVGV